MRALLDAGADARVVDRYGFFPVSTGRLCLAVVQMLCAYGAHCEQLIKLYGSARHADLPDECRAWLLETRHWTSELHFVELLSAACVRTLIVAGANLCASDGGGGDAPTPLAIARELFSRSSDGHVGAQLVVDAAAPWSPTNHALFPKAARSRAMALLLLGRLLLREERFKHKESARCSTRGRRT